MTAYYKAKPCSRKDLRKLALMIRTMLHLENLLYFPIVEVYEILAANGMFDFEVLPKEEMGNKYGETFPSEKRIAIREDIYDKACIGKPFARSTMAHELLHFLSHDEVSVSLCRTSEEAERIKPYEDPEWQADCFAGELLVPCHLAKGMGVEDVMEQCKVSRAMAEMQLRKYEEGK